MEEGNFPKPLLPSPQIPDSFQKLRAPHFSTAAGMLLPRGQQPPPMFGLRGSTIPAKFLNLQQNHPYKNNIVTETNDQQGQQFPRNYQRPPAPPPTANPLVYCELCDRCFRNDDKLYKHKVDFHSEVLGIKPKVYTEEEISEWKNERKKRYPTTNNILLRQQAQEERRKRGERLEPSKNRFGRKEDRDRAKNFTEPRNNQNTNQRGTEGRQNNKNNSKKRRQRNRKHTKNQTTTKPESNIEDSKPDPKVSKNILPEKVEKIELNGLPMFQGTLNLPDYHTSTQVPEIPKEEPNALSLLGNYGTESETEDEDINPEPTIKPLIEADSENIPEPSTESTTNSQLESSYQDHEPPLELPIAKTDPCPDQPMLLPHEVPQTNSNKRNRKRKRRKSSIESTGPVPEDESEIPEKVSKADNNQEVTPVQDKNESNPSLLENTPSTSKLKEVAQSHSKYVKKPTLQYRFHRYQNTLLEKLLEPDIRHERNVLLQCVRYVVQNNFFGIGQKKESEPENSPETSNKTPDDNQD